MTERSFGSLAEFAAHLTGSVIHIEHAQHEQMERATKVVEKEAKRVIGSYDYGWAPLAEATKQERARLGFPADEPLLRTGELRDSIEHSVGRDHWYGGVEGRVGSNLDKAVWQEMGTQKIPPRSFLLQAAVHKEEEVVDILGRSCIKGLERTP